MNHGSTISAQTDDRRRLSSADEGEALLGAVLDTMDGLARTLEAENALVRRGKLVEAGRLGPEKSELARRYVRDLQIVQANGPMLRATAPALVERVRARHDAFRALLTVNLTVLATAKAVAENIVQEIAETVARQDQPVGYQRQGGLAPTTPRNARPVTLSRSV